MKERMRPVRAKGPRNQIESLGMSACLVCDDSEELQAVCLPRPLAQDAAVQALCFGHAPRLVKPDGHRQALAIGPVKVKPTIVCAILVDNQPVIIDILKNGGQLTVTQPYQKRLDLLIGVTGWINRMYDCQLPVHGPEQDVEYRQALLRQHGVEVSLVERRETPAGWREAVWHITVWNAEPRQSVTRASDSSVASFFSPSSGLSTAPCPPPP